MEERPEGARSGGMVGELWDIAKVILIALAIVLPIRYFIVQPFIVRGASMEPSFEDREYLIVDEASYFFRTPERGEVIVFRYPRNTSQFFIKRVIGLPGERVEIKNGRITIFNASNPNGRRLNETYLSSPALATYPDNSYALGTDEFFVLGDNRGSSSDSRVWGPLERKFMVGRVFFRILPFARMGQIANGT